MSGARIDLRVLREGPDAEPKAVVVSSRWTESGKPIPFPSGRAEVPRSSTSGVAVPRRGHAASCGGTARRVRSRLRAFARRVREVVW